MAARTKKSAFVAFNQLRVSSDAESDDSADERQQEKREKQKQKKKSRNKKKNSDSAQLKDLAFCAVSKPKKNKAKGKSKQAAQPGPPPEGTPAETAPTSDSQAGQEEVRQGVTEPKRALADVIKGPPPANVKQHETNHAPSPKQPQHQQPRAPSPAASPPAAGAPPSTSEAELGAVYSPTTIKITRVDGQITRMVAVSDVMDQLLLYGQQNSQLLMVQEQLGVRDHASEGGLAVGKCLAIV
ncbi:hypothetical protein BBJ28_00025896 [Nothophytophthora sp. Chile5]|nr:hypothetical protein BBJ28_00025896 [Nothophytophthora sp. Chile5]